MRSILLFDNGSHFQCVALLFAVFAVASLLSSPIYPQFEKDVEWANDRMQNADRSANRTELLQSVIEKLEPYKGSNQDAAELIAVLQLQKALLGVDHESLNEDLEKALNASDRLQRQEALEAVRLDLIERAAMGMEIMDPSNLSLEDIERYTTVVKSASKVIDELNDPSLLGSKSSALTKIASFGDGILKLNRSLQQPDAKDILSGLNSTVGAFKPKIRNLGVSAPSVFSPHQLPASVLTAMNGVTMQGWRRTSTAIEDVGAAIGGDADALNRLPGHANAVNRTLSPKTYGKAMLDSIADVVTSRIPLYKSLGGFLFDRDDSTDKDQASLNWLVGRWQHGTLVIEFQRTDEGVIGILINHDDETKRMKYFPGDVLWRYVENEPLKEDYHRRGRRRAVGVCRSSYRRNQWHTDKSLEHTLGSGILGLDNDCFWKPGGYRKIAEGVQR